MEYHSYLVRTWREGSGKDVRISIQNILTGERSNFYSLFDYFNYLCAELQLPTLLQKKEHLEEGESPIRLSETMQNNNLSTNLEDEFHET